MTYEQIVKANELLPKIDIKGKAYAAVPARIQAFRQLCPNGSIETEIISMENGVVTMKATAKDENGKVLGTGFAQEKETASYINKTSYIENCETSAVGRALGMLGIGSESNIASAEEMVNALVNQQKTEKAKAELIDATMINALMAAADNAGVTVEMICKQFELKSLSEMTVGQYRECCVLLEEYTRKTKGKK